MKINVTCMDLENLGCKSLKDPSGYFLSEENLKTYTDHFGVSPKVFSTVWNRCHFEGKKIGNVRLSPKHLLWGLMFLKTYGGTRTLCRAVGVKSPKTFRKYQWFVVKEISKLLPKVVSQ